MAEQPVALICDLSGISSIAPACAAVFPTAWRESGGWPGVSLNLCSARPQVKARLWAEGTMRFVAVHNDVGSAVDAARTLPPYVSHTTRLRFDPQAAREARLFARATLLRWGMRDVVDDALLLVSEMVSNCVRHGAPPLRLTLRLRSGLLRIAVNDGGPGVPRPRLSSVPPEGVINGVHIAGSGRGLTLVAAISTAWGISEYAAGPGKTMWCELQVDSSIGNPHGAHATPAAEHRHQGEFIKYLAHHAEPAQFGDQHRHAGPGGSVVYLDRGSRARR